MNRYRQLVTASESPAPLHHWECPSCGKKGWSLSHHGALERLKNHWRTCAVTCQTCMDIPGSRTLCCPECGR